MDLAASQKDFNVAPFAGAWIEIVLNGGKTKVATPSHPSRVRGLKLTEEEFKYIISVSHPSRVRGLK